MNPTCNELDINQGNSGTEPLSEHSGGVANLLGMNAESPLFVNSTFLQQKRKLISSMIPNGW
jgi:hypothetical protein